MAAEHNGAQRIPGDGGPESMGPDIDFERMAADARRREAILEAGTDVPQSLVMTAIVRGIPLEDAVRAFNEYRSTGFTRLDGGEWGEKKKEG